jgi:hypothetical protein
VEKVRLRLAKALLAIAIVQGHPLGRCTLHDIDARYLRAAHLIEMNLNSPQRPSFAKS